MTTPSSGLPLVPYEQYVASRPRKRLVAGVLFRDHAGRVLLVEPSYKPNWEIPGGAVEEDESPWAAAAREVAEEVGWERPLGRLLVIDHVQPQDALSDGVVFIFDGGVLDDRDVAGMEFRDGEILSASFHTPAQSRGRVMPLLADRIVAALAAAEQGVLMLCENGRHLG